MLDRIKREDTYPGIVYDHRGPARLSIGHKAVAVGQSFHQRLPP